MIYLNINIEDIYTNESVSPLNNYVYENDIEIPDNEIYKIILVDEIPYIPDLENYVNLESLLIFTSNNFRLTKKLHAHLMNDFTLNLPKLKKLNSLSIIGDILSDGFENINDNLFTRCLNNLPINLEILTLSCYLPVQCLKLENFPVTLKEIQLELNRNNINFEKELFNGEFDYNSIMKLPFNCKVKAVQFYELYYNYLKKIY